MNLKINKLRTLAKLLDSNASHAMLFFVTESNRQTTVPNVCRSTDQIREGEPLVDHEEAKAPKLERQWHGSKGKSSGQGRGALGS